MTMATAAACLRGFIDDSPVFRVEVLGLRSKKTNKAGSNKKSSNKANTIAMAVSMPISKLILNEEVVRTRKPTVRITVLTKIATPTLR